MDSQSPMVLMVTCSPLHVAVRQGQLEDVRTILFRQQVDVNILNSKHETPLHLACSQRDSAIIQLLISIQSPSLSTVTDHNRGHSHARRVLHMQLQCMGYML